LSYYLKFRIESNSYCSSQKSPVVKYLLNKFNCFYGTAAVVIAYRTNHICIVRTNLCEMAPY